MPTDPSKDTPVSPPDAPRAGPANGAAPWSAATLARLDAWLETEKDPASLPAADLGPVELVHAPRLPPAPWLPARVPSGPTAPAIRIEESTPRASNDGQHLPDVVRGPGGLRDIAGSPLTSLAGTAELCFNLSNELSCAAEMQASSPCSSLVLLRHVTPEFDSTHQIMRIPVPQQTPPAAVLQEAAADAAASSIALQGSATPHTPPRAASTFEPDINQLPAPPLSAALGNAWRALQPLPMPITTVALSAPPLLELTTVALSAPPLLERLPAVPPLQRRFDAPGSEYRQALASEGEQLASLSAVELGELRHHAPPKPQYTPMPAALRVSLYAHHQASREFGDGACGVSDSADVELVGTPAPAWHAGLGAGTLPDL